MSLEILKFIEEIQREKGIETDIIYRGIETALFIAINKRYHGAKVFFDRTNGNISVTLENGETPPINDFLDRFIARKGKDIILHQIRKAQIDIVYNEFNQKYHQLITGEVHRYEGNDIFLMVGDTEIMLPAEEQVLGENHPIGARLRAYVIQVNRNFSEIRIAVSRSHPQFVRKLFELEVPEIQQGLVEIKALVREAGYRSKVAVLSTQPKIDPIGACVGIRGARIHNVLDELRGEKVEIIRWDDNLEKMICNALKPAEISKIELDKENKKAKVWVTPDQHRNAIGKDGQNVRLAAKLCYCDIDILSTT